MPSDPRAVGVFFLSVLVVYVMFGVPFSAAAVVVHQRWGRPGLLVLLAAALVFLGSLGAAMAGAHPTTAQRLQMAAVTVWALGVPMGGPVRELGWAARPRKGGPLRRGVVAFFTIALVVLVLSIAGGVWMRMR
ncbi:MAG TPA: hypothetical protein VFE05_00380 [Longimicrobiaceae bacterium]|jgi:hypothetical protein|nr:hypothetical protein [Longimicrobiaceae bacterium]